MGIEIVNLIHASVRIGASEKDVAKAREFYANLLGLETDTGRPHIPTIPGFWSNVRSGDRSQQIHVMGADGVSLAAKSPKEDPTRTHIAFTVADLEMARETLTLNGIEFWEMDSLVGTGSMQLFLEDPFGNVIELQQAAD